MNFQLNIFRPQQTTFFLLCNSIMGPGGISMRPGMPVVPRYTEANATRNYFLYMKRRKTGLVANSGTLDNNI